MASIPLRRIILYKHGVGYFERRGTVEGTTLTLQFDHDAMDDVLKSLVVLEIGESQIRSIDYERPELWSSRRLTLGPQRAIRDLLQELRGRSVSLQLANGEQSVGLLIGIDEPHEEQPLNDAIVSLFQPTQRHVAVHALRDIQGVQLRDSAATDLAFVLRSSANADEVRSATVQLGEGTHDLLVAYVAPAPSWRVSYRLIIDDVDDELPTLLLQGWGIIDNVLDEDLDDVRVSLVAGRPISFRYGLYEPHQPERPLLTDAPPPPTPEPMPRASKMRMMAAAAPQAFAMEETSLADAMLAAAPSVAEGQAQGALFRYDVRELVSIGRGKSALLPLLNLRTACRRELVYRGASGERHPMTTVRFENTSGLTLERGPVTIIEQRAYGGEAVIEWAAEGSEVAVRYAQALELTVSETRTTEHHTRRLRLGNDALIHEVEESIITTYIADNTAGAERLVCIEHPRRAHYELYDTATPDELRSDVARWRLIVDARTEKTHQVRERRLIERREAIRSLNVEQLRVYLRDRMLDQTTVSELRDILLLYQRLDEIAQQHANIATLRQGIYDQQTQIRGNLDVLRTDGEEGELRNRYITTLGQTEDHLVALRDQEANLHQEEADRRLELAQRLKALGAEASR